MAPLHHNNDGKTIQVKPHPHRQLQLHPLLAKVTKNTSKIVQHRKKFAPMARACCKFLLVEIFFDLMELKVAGREPTNHPHLLQMYKK